MFGLIPRFCKYACPECGGTIESIDNDTIRKNLGLLIIDKIPYSFTWRKLIE